MPSIDDLAPKLTAALWQLRVRRDGFDDVLVRFPADRDWRQAIINQLGAGRVRVFRVRLQRRGRVSMAAECKRLGIEQGAVFRFETHDFGVRSDREPTVAERPSDAARRANATRHGRRGESALAEVFPEPLARTVMVDELNAAEHQDPAIARELRAAELTRAQTARAVAERELREAQAGAPVSSAPAASAPPAGLELVTALIQQQAETTRALLQSFSEREARMHAELLELRRSPPAATAPPAPVDPTQQLGQLASAFNTMRELLGMVEQLRPATAAGDDEDEGGSDLVRILREGRRLLELQGGQSPSLPGQRGAAAPARPAPPPAPRAVPSPAAERCAAFLQAIMQEAETGSDPEAAAELLEQSASMLPAPIREAIGTGNWRTAWQAFAPIIGAPEWGSIDTLLAASAERGAWLSAFVAELAAIWNEPDDDATGTDDA